jgi:acyl dehydratase
MLETNLQVKGPTMVGDTIHVEVEVTAIRATSKGNRGIVTTRNDIVNQKGETPITYTVTRMMAGRN